MPRRSKLDPESGAQASADPDDIWTDGTHPTVVDMAAIDADLIGEPVLPNYEEDRRLA